MRIPTWLTVCPEEVDTTVNLADYNDGSLQVSLTRGSGQHVTGKILCDVELYDKGDRWAPSGDSILCSREVADLKEHRSGLGTPLHSGKENGIV